MTAVECWPSSPFRPREASRLCGVFLLRQEHKNRIRWYDSGTNVKGASMRHKSYYDVIRFIEVIVMLAATVFLVALVVMSIVEAVN